jgi:protein-S-isoprenylcysteine O-methyltransferase Ste14
MANHAPSATNSPTYVIRRESLAERRAQRRQGARTGYGGLIIATILVVVGVAVFFPELPWYAFWGCLWILLGVWIAFGWTQRGHGTSGPAQPANVNQ